MRKKKNSFPKMKFFPVLCEKLADAQREVLKVDFR